MHSQPLLLPSSRLFFSRRFLPLFVIQFLGALTDNLFRNAIFVLVTFRLATTESLSAPVIVSMGAGLFILPFFLFSATAGAIADRYEKSRLVRQLKLIECALVALGGAALVSENVPFMLFSLTLFGIQSAFFGPIKYSVLPPLVGPQALVPANAYVEGGTFLAILIGTITGGLAVTFDHGTWIVAALMIGLSLIAWLTSFGIPATEIGDVHLKVSWRLWNATRAILHDALHDPLVKRAIFGISWFWFVGAVFLSVLPNYVKNIIGGDPHLITFLLALFSIGIGVGSVACNVILRDSSDTRFVAVSATGMSIAALAVALLPVPHHEAHVVMTTALFLSDFRGVAISLALLGLALAGGLFTVPLYSIMQARTSDRDRARVIASNNIVNAFFMVVSSLFTMAMFNAHFSVMDIFLVLGLMTLGAAVYLRPFSRP